MFAHHFFKHTSCYLLCVMTAMPLIIIQTWSVHQRIPQARNIYLGSTFSWMFWSPSLSQLYKLTFSFVISPPAPLLYFLLNFLVFASFFLFCVFSTSSNPLHLPFGSCVLYSLVGNNKKCKCSNSQPDFVISLLHNNCQCKWELIFIRVKIACFL